jgi:hypothetical protein
MNTDANKTVFEGTLKPLQNATRLYEATVCPPSIAIFEVVDGSTAWRPKNYENASPFERGASTQKQSHCTVTSLVGGP